MSTFAILGASGYLGSYLSTYLSTNGHEVISISRTHSSQPNSIRISGLNDFGPTLERISSRVDVVVNSVAIASHEKCFADKNLAQLVNAEMPGRWAAIARENGLDFVHISSDAVFDGEQESPYTEVDSANPQTFYGISKLGGELAVASKNSDALILRTNFFGWSPIRGTGVLEFFYRNLTEQREVFGFNDYFVSSTYMGFLAEALVTLRDRGASGIYHVAARDSMSKYDFGMAVAECFDLPAASLKSGAIRDATGLGPRGKNLSLSTRKLEAEIDRASPTVRQAISMAKDELPLFIQQFSAHSKL